MFKDVRTWAFAVKASENVRDLWPLKEFENGIYHLMVYGPNGFYREFKGSVNDPGIGMHCDYQTSATNKPTGNIDLFLSNKTNRPVTIEITDNAYKLYR